MTKLVDPAKPTTAKTGLTADVHPCSSAQLNSAAQVIHFINLLRSLL